MFSEEVLESLKAKIMEKLREEEGGCGQDGALPSLITRPSVPIVILGLLFGVLEPFSLLIDINKRVEIVLVGDLKRTTEVDKMMDGLGGHSFEEVMRSMLGKYG